MIMQITWMKLKTKLKFLKVIRINKMRMQITWMRTKMKFLKAILKTATMEKTSSKTKTMRNSSSIKLNQICRNKIVYVAIAKIKTTIVMMMKMNTMSLKLQMISASWLRGNKITKKLKDKQTFHRFHLLNTAITDYYIHL